MKNFQSIEDAEIIVDGFVVICGPNNSGKTALIRAIRGLFNNAASGSYLRQGANFLSVELEFEDGTTVLWEKGWEKPGKKGAAINRYTINGYQIASVGRGVPPEVEALGVKSIFAGNTPIWPQIADQFDGTLFLVNKTGAVVAEALSDVERVGKLTEALRLSERDKRAFNSELKVRRDDLKSLQDEVRKFQGIDAIGKKIQHLGTLKGEALDKASLLGEAKALRGRYLISSRAWESLKGYSVEIPVEPKGCRDYSPLISNLRSLRRRLQVLNDTSQNLEGFRPPQFHPEQALSLRDSLLGYRAFHEKLKKLERESSLLEKAILPKFSDPSKLERIKKVLGIVRDFRNRWASNIKILTEIGSEERTVKDLTQQNSALVRELLGERGYCPTCRTVHTGDTHI